MFNFPNCLISEISLDKSCLLLCDVLKNDHQDPEIRAGAAWALGELGNRFALRALMDSFSAVDDSIRVEAARALAKLGSSFTPEIVKEFPKVSPDKRPGIAWALSKSKKLKFEDLLKAMADFHEQMIDQATEVGGEELYNKWKARATILRDTANNYMSVK